MTLGLLQGDSLSPLLFALYISEIEKCLQESETDGIKINRDLVIHLLLFADDTVVLAPYAGALKRKIKALEDYFDSLSLQVNLSKTKILVFRKGGRIEKNLSFSYKGEKIDIVPEYIYLGILMKSSVLFRSQTQRAKTKAMQVVHTTLQLIFRTKLASFHSHYTLFESVIKSTLLYGCAVWAQRYKRLIEPVQNNYYRRVLGLQPRLPTALIRKETASEFIEVSIWEQTLSFIGKIKKMGTQRYASAIFNKLVQLDEDNPSLEYNWVTQVKRGLLTFGLDQIMTASAPDFYSYLEPSIAIIKDHFREHDRYLVQRLESYPQYQTIFSYGREERNSTESREAEQAKRWSNLPWHLQSDLRLGIKRLITQLRQDNVYIRMNDVTVSIPHRKDKVQCSYCNRKEYDCPKHALFYCPITAVTSQSLQSEGWNPSEYMEFLDQPWENAEHIFQLVMQTIKIRQYITKEAESQQ